LTIEGSSSAISIRGAVSPGSNMVMVCASKLDLDGCRHRGVRYGPASTAGSSHPQ
jgi:hypothetical protein